tara:strand:- start:399 stop:773 length:375 start_codon:yes stop_codon:yes gene_type:complete
MAGSVTITYSRDTIYKYVQWAWTSDASGDVSGEDTKVLVGRVLRWATNPSGTAPSDNYDIVVNDEDGIDIAAGDLANRDTSTSEQVLTGGDAKDGATFHGTLSLVVSNAGNAKEGVLKMYYQGE